MEINTITDTPKPAESPEQRAERLLKKKLNNEKRRAANIAKGLRGDGQPRKTPLAELPFKCRKGCDRRFKSMYQRNGHEAGAHGRKSKHGRHKKYRGWSPERRAKFNATVRNKAIGNNNSHRIIDVYTKEDAMAADLDTRERDLLRAFNLGREFEKHLRGEAQ